MSRFSLYLFILSTFCILAFGDPAFGHEMPDGEIERKVQVSVKQDRVLVEYSLAMNEETLNAEITKKGIEPAASLAEKWNQYKQIALPSIAKKLKLRMSGEVIPFKPVQANYSGWSHGHLDCLFKADVSFKKQRTTIVVNDGCFPDTPGDYRIAMKGRSGVKIENGTVPVLVSQAKPLNLVGLSGMQKKDAAKAQGEVVLEKLR